MLKLRFPWLWWALGSLLVAGVVGGSLIPGEYVPGFLARDKLVHAGSYGLLMLWFAGLYRRERHLIIALALFALGFGLDVAQSGTATRSFDLLDVAADAGGIIAAFVLARYLFAGWCQRVEQLLVP